MSTGTCSRHAKATPAAFARPTRSQASLGSMVMGFSTRTSTWAAIAAAAGSWWASCGVATTHGIEPQRQELVNRSDSERYVEAARLPRGHGRPRHRKPRLFRRVGWKRAPASAYAWTTSRCRRGRRRPSSLPSRRCARRRTEPLPMTHRAYPPSVPLEDWWRQSCTACQILRYRC